MMGIISIVGCQPLEEVSQREECLSKKDKIKSGHRCEDVSSQNNGVKHDNTGI